MLNRGDTIQAASLLLDYFSSVDRKWVMSTLDTSSIDRNIMIAKALLHDSVYDGDLVVKIPILEKGGWQWDFTGPNKDDEFGYGLNGHKYLPSLIHAWEFTAEDRYVIKYDQIIRDWIINHPLPDLKDSIYLVLDTTRILDWRDIGEVEWRTLEAGHRLGAGWLPCFFALQNHTGFTAATRLLMLSSLLDQARYLYAHHKSGHNWTTMEMNGLALAALSFPEFKESEGWADYALDVMIHELQRQVYPDGVQTEISTKTQWVALRRFESIADHFRKVGKPVSEAYTQRLEKMYTYLALCMRPDGYQPINNDADREDLRPRILKAASKFNRQDWVWPATNGQKGIEPSEGPSITFPWSGIHIFRSGWEALAHWSFFDTGPYGTGHQHRDMLHLSITAYGKDLLVDGGRYTHQDYFSFDPAVWRGYFRSSFSHNVILIDGAGQNPGPVKAASELVPNQDFLHEDSYDFATGVFKEGYTGVAGRIEHQRSVMYVHDQFWVVLDQIHTDRRRNIQALWHYAPGYKVNFEGNECVSINDASPNLRIIPLGKLNWQTEVVSGMTEPHIQGWYSETYGKKVENACVVYSANIQENSVFGWLLVPGMGTVLPVNVHTEMGMELVSIAITSATQKNINISIPLHGNIEQLKLEYK